MVHQELNQCLERNVIDNLFLGRYPRNSMGVIDEGRMKREASELFRKLGMTVNLTQPMRNMSVSQRQMCIRDSHRFQKFHPFYEKCKSERYPGLLTFSSFQTASLLPEYSEKM